MPTPIVPTRASTQSDIEQRDSTGITFDAGGPANDTYLPRLGFGGPPDRLPPIHDGFGGDDDDDEFDDSDNAGGKVDWCTLAVFWSVCEAHLARIKLEAAGVPCLLLDELTCSTGCFAIAAGGVKLQVPRQFLIEAASVLRQREGGNVDIASFTGHASAKMAACIIEAGQIECVVVESAGEFLLVVAVDDARAAAARLLETPFAAAVEPWVGARPARCFCGLHPGKPRVHELPAAARRRYLAQVILQWIDRHLPTPLRPRRCLACGADREVQLLTATPAIDAN